jgi:hypothetical protein
MSNMGMGIVSFFHLGTREKVIADYETQTLI